MPRQLFVFLSVSVVATTAGMSADQRSLPRGAPR